MYICVYPVTFHQQTSAVYTVSSLALNFKALERARVVVFETRLEYTMSVVCGCVCVGGCVCVCVCVGGVCTRGKHLGEVPAARARQTSPWRGDNGPRADEEWEKDNAPPKQHAT